MTKGATRFAMLDLDGTLVDSVAALRRWAHRLCTDYGLPQETAEWLIEQRDLYDSWQTFAAAAADHVGRPEHTMEWKEHLLQHYPNEIVLEPATAQRLGALREAGWKLAVVTNGSVAMQSAKIEQVQLADYVDVVCISEAAGVRKPDRAIFENAAGQLGVGLGRHGWMVGDNLRADVGGGLGAGVRTIWLSDQDVPRGTGAKCPADTPGCPAPRPDHVCGSIAAALDHILASV